MNKEFERCCTFLAEMMQKEKDFGMRLMRRDFWSGLRKLHKGYRHPAKFVSSFHRKLDM